MHLRRAAVADPVLHCSERRVAVVLLPLRHVREQATHGTRHGVQGLQFLRHGGQQILQQRLRGLRGARMARHVVAGVKRQGGGLDVGELQPAMCMSGAAAVCACSTWQSTPKARHLELVRTWSSGIAPYWALAHSAATLTSAARRVYINPTRQTCPHTFP